MPFNTPNSTNKVSNPSSINTTFSNLDSILNTINQKIEYYDDLDENKQNYLQKVKSGEDKKEAKKCHDLLKQLVKAVDEVKTKEEYTKALDTTEDFDAFCTIFPKDILDRYFKPKFETVFDKLDEKYKTLSGASTGVTPTSGASTGVTPASGSSSASDYTGPSIIDYLDKKGEPSDFESRRAMAVKMGIVSSPDQYKGTAEQNTKMLNMLRGNQGASNTTQQSATSVTPATLTDQEKGLIDKAWQFRNNPIARPQIEQAWNSISNEKKLAAIEYIKSKGWDFNEMKLPLPSSIQTPSQPSKQSPNKELLSVDKNGNSLLFVRIGPGNYRPAVKADQAAGVQLFARNPNPALRLVYPFIKVQNMPVRRAGFP